MISPLASVRLWLCGRVPDLQSGGCGFESQPGLLRTTIYTQPSIPPGSVNEYQLRLGRQRRVWLIPIADERLGVQVKLRIRNPLRTRAIPERSAVVIHYEEALYQVYAPLPYIYL